MNEPDINFRAAFALSGWRPIHPLEKAAEYFEFDFEFGDEPEDSGLKANAKVISLTLKSKEESEGATYLGLRRAFQK